MAKEYISGRVSEAVSMCKKARGLLHDVWNAQLDIIREDKEVVAREENMLAELRKLDDELKTVEVQGKVLDEAVKAKSGELVRSMSNGLKEKIALVLRALKTIANKEHALEEKKRSGAKNVQKEWKDIVGAGNLILQLKGLEESITSLASGFISKAKRRQVKI